jgi:hypothetical protein
MNSGDVSEAWRERERHRRFERAADLARVLGDIVMDL